MAKILTVASIRLNIKGKADNITKIIIITHTIPSIEFNDGREDGATVYNTKFKNILNKFSKIKTWIFGHLHSNIDVKQNGVRYICNARGRPGDYERIHYSMESIYL